jgi:methionyl-tRNA formyltransferase
MRDSKAIRIVFMGTPGFAVGVLQKLVEKKYNVVAVVTAADKPAGRGQKLRESEVKQFAVAHNIPVLQPEKLKSPEFLEQLRAFDPELQIVVAFRMLPEVVWQMPPLGTFNLHASLLPQYRGAAPINRAIMNGETQTGVTTFFLQHEIDTGNVLFREETIISPDETAGELHDRLMEIGASLVAKTVDAIAEQTISAVPQNVLAAGEQLREAPKIFRDDCRIHWDRTAKSIHDHVRGLSPYPGAWTAFKTGDVVSEMKIFRTKLFTKEAAQQSGATDKFPWVKMPDGYLFIEEIQPAGKKKMRSGEFLNGLQAASVELL